MHGRWRGGCGQSLVTPPSVAAPPLTLRCIHDAQGACAAEPRPQPELSGCEITVLGFLGVRRPGPLVYLPDWKTRRVKPLREAQCRTLRYVGPLTGSFRCLRLLETCRCDASFFRIAFLKCQNLDDQRHARTHSTLPDLSQSLCRDLGTRAIYHTVAGRLPRTPCTNPPGFDPRHPIYSP